METTKPRILIAGGGISGLFLAICFERAGISYCICERANELKPLGTAIFLSASVAPLLMQLGIYDDLVSVSKQGGAGWVRREDMTLASPMLDFSALAQRIGYPGITMSRPDLHRILLSKVPADKVILGKRLLSVTQSEEVGNEGVTAKFSDGTIATADILVAADGAYSAARQSIFNDLKEKGLLPTSDCLPLQATSSCLVGVTTESIDPKDCPAVAEEKRISDFILVDTAPYVYVLFTMPKNKIAFMVLKDIKAKGTETEMFKATQWSPETAMDFANQVRDFKTPYGGELSTLGGIFDKTNPATMSKVMLEQKLFKTWYHGRVVLIGDACHKMTPHAGLGAINAMFDAASLSSHLNDLGENKLAAYTKAFAAYKNDRYDFAKQAVKTSHNMEALFRKKGLISRMLQHAFLNWIPKSIIIRSENALHGPKPQVTFLPFIDDNAEVKSPLVQKQSAHMAPRSKWATAPVSV